MKGPKLHKKSKEEQSDMPSNKKNKFQWGLKQAKPRYRVIIKSPWNSFCANKVFVFSIESALLQIWVSDPVV